MEGNKKSRTYRRVAKRTPGSKVKITYQRRKPSKAACGKCGANLKGVPRELPHKMQSLPKTQKRPDRAFGGNLCTKCSRETLRQKARVMLK